MITALPQTVLTVLAVALGLTPDGDRQRVMTAVAMAWLCCVPVVVVRRLGHCLMVIALMTAALGFVLDPGGLAYVAFCAGTAAVAAHCLHRLRATLDACRSHVHGERRRAAQQHRRLQRDLHDLLGYSLSAIVVQAELVRHRLAGEHTEGQAEAVELISLSRRALAEARSLAAGPQQLSLARELASVQRVLRTAGLDIDVDVDTPAAYDRDVEAALAAVLREGTTNILRHSHARACRITMGGRGNRTVLVLSNDGFEPSGGEESGTGLESLSERVEAVGGTLTWSHDKGWFRLRAVCPAASGRVALPATASRPDPQSARRPADCARSAASPRR
ncbi:sensor histidine kinase [Streptomyces sp. NPDC001492]